MENWLICEELPLQKVFVLHFLHTNALNVVHCSQSPSWSICSSWKWYENNFSCLHTICWNV